MSVSAILPFSQAKKTFGNFLHKGFIFSFIDFLDSCISSNKSLADIVEELQGEEEMSENSIRCAFSVLGIISRGMIAYGMLYLSLGVIGYSGYTKGGTRPAVLAKPPKRRQQIMGSISLGRNLIALEHCQRNSKPCISAVILVVNLPQTLRQTC